MINNTNTIRALLRFPDENSFYFLEVIKRRKDNPDMEVGQKLVKDFFIYSLKEFDDLVPKVIALCQESTARAYFRLNRRDAHKIALRYNLAVGEALVNGQYKSIRNLYSSTVGKWHCDENKTWVVDVDRDEGEGFPKFYTALLNKIIELNPDAIVAILPTKNGLHIITRPFRLDLFKKDYPKVEVHKDNPTILFAP